MKNKNYLNINLQYIIHLNCSITTIQGFYPLNFIIEDDKFEVSTENEKLFTGVFSNVEERALFLNFFKSVVNSFKYSSKNLKPKVKGFLSLARKMIYDLCNLTILTQIMKKNLIRFHLNSIKHTMEKLSI